MRLFLAALLLMTLSVANMANAAGLSAYDIARLEEVRTAVVSPDGRLVAFTKAVPRNPMTGVNGKDYSELWVQVVGEESPRAFITGTVNVSRVSFTPDGRSISFLAKRDEDKKTALYLIPTNGGESTRLLSHGEAVKEYAFSPSMNRVAWLAQDPVGAAAEELKEKGFDAEVYEETVRPTRLHLASLEAGELKTSTQRTLDLDGSLSMLHWSPAGDRLAVAISPTPHIDDHYMERQIHFINPAGEVLGVVDTQGKLASMAFSPDGARIALVGPAHINDPAAGRLLVASSDGGVATDLMPGYEGHVRHVGWSDRKTVVYVADQYEWTTVGSIQADGKNSKTLVKTGGPVMTSLSLSTDGKQMAMVGSHPTHPGELFLARNGQSPTRTTDSNPWLSEFSLGEQAPVRFMARDGLELSGILIKPVGYREGTRIPLILAVHGGPESNERNGWLTRYSRPGQMAAAKGMAVFYPNYRGSTGRGLEFSMLSQGDPAGKEFDDLVDAKQHFVESGLADGARVGITGGSYGGYASAWGATALSEHFAASVMFVGISNQISKFGTTDISKEMYHVHQRKWMWDGHWQFYLDRSPIYHAAKQKTPLLILHGKEDPRVHPSQSLELYRNVKHRGQAPVRLVWYPGEQHGNRKAAGKLDYSLRSMRWFETFLQGDGEEMPPTEIEVDSGAMGVEVVESPQATSTR